MYEVIDSKTGNRMGIYKTLKSARRAANRLDNEYGSHRYSLRSIE